MQCYTCFGTGHVTGTCPACGGKGSYWKVVGGKNQWQPCYQCGGRRTVTVRCTVCGGTGTLPDKPGIPSDVTPSPVAPPKPKLPPDPALLQLAGRWKGTGWTGTGLRYEFVNQNGSYNVTAFNFLGMKIGEGEAEASGSVLTLTVRNKLTGGIAITVDLQLSGNRLAGKTKGLISQPFAIERA